MRKNEKLMWGDPEFIRRLEIIKANRLINGKKCSMADITRDMTKTKEFMELEKKLSKMEKEGFLRYD